MSKDPSSALHLRLDFELEIEVFVAEFLKAIKRRKFLLLTGLEIRVVGSSMKSLGFCKSY